MFIPICKSTREHSETSCFLSEPIISYAGRLARSGGASHWRYQASSIFWTDGFRRTPEAFDVFISHGESLVNVLFRGNDTGKRKNRLARGKTGPSRVFPLALSVPVCNAQDIMQNAHF